MMWHLAIMAPGKCGSRENDQGEDKVPEQLAFPSIKVLPGHYLLNPAPDQV